MLTKIRNAIKGWKTYLLGTAAIITSIVAWAEGTVTDVGVVTAIFAAFGMMFLRAGIAKN